MITEIQKRREKVKDSLSKKGLTYSQFCEINNVSKSLVEDLINLKISGRIGKSHKVAVLLGLKDGEIIEL